jgi:outer membrane lipoprotein-sorting protein
MIKLIRFFCVILILVFSCRVFAEETQFINKLHIALKNIEKRKSFSVEFSQEFYSALRERITNSEGIVKIQAPSSWIFEVKTPRHEIYINNGVDFWKYSPKLKHAQYLSSNSLDLSYLNLFMNPQKITSLYHVSEWLSSETLKTENVGQIPDVQSDKPPAKNADYVLIKLEPKRDNSQKVLYAILNASRGALEELRVVQSNGNRIRLLFKNEKEEIFNSKTFLFTPPAGIVIDKN